MLEVILHTARTEENRAVTIPEILKSHTRDKPTTGDGEQSGQAILVLHFNSCQHNKSMLQQIDICMFLGWCWTIEGQLREILWMLTLIWSQLNKIFIFVEVRTAVFALAQLAIPQQMLALLFYRSLSCSSPVCYCMYSMLYKFTQ